MHRDMAAERFSIISGDVALNPMIVRVIVSFQFWENTAEKNPVS